MSFLNLWSDRTLRSAPGVEDRMREAGIHGIKYLDEQSRDRIAKAEIQRDIDQYKQAIAERQNRPGLPLSECSVSVELDTLQNALRFHEKRLADWRELTQNAVVFDDKLVNITRKFGSLGGK